jgi:SdrD B-like domain/Peptidase_C39 like family
MAATPATAPSAAATTPTPAPTATTPTPVPTANATASATLVAATGSDSIHGTAFLDTNADGQIQDAEPFLENVAVTLTFQNGLSRTAHTDNTGAFTFDGLPAGTYHIAVTVPTDYVPTTDSGQDIEVVDDAEPPNVLFGLITTEAAGLSPDGSAPAPTSDDEQIIALASVTSLPLRFAQGRDLMNQVQKRVLGDGLVWLGVPFRSQMDGGDFQYVNCGPASLTMVLAGFGLEVGPSQVRDYLNNLIDNFDTDLGTSLDVLSRISKEAGLTPMDLYSDHGGYRNWSTDAVRWHLQQGHPVITLVKYRNLPGHTSSLSQFDHYIVISGLTPNGFIYNDAAFASTLGYGLEISDVELEYAWNNSSIPHHAVALGLAPDAKALTFPELPRKPRTPTPDGVATARNARRLAAADETPRAPLLLTPSVATIGAPAAAVGPLIAERWADDPNFDVAPPTDDGAPMGLTLDPGDQPVIEARPGPGAEVPKLLTLIGLAWALWLVWSMSGRLARRLPSVGTLCRIAIAGLRLPGRVAAVAFAALTSLRS